MTKPDTVHKGPFQLFPISKRDCSHKGVTIRLEVRSKRSVWVRKG